MCRLICISIQFRSHFNSSCFGSVEPAPACTLTLGLTSAMLAVVVVAVAATAVAVAAVVAVHAHRFQCDAYAVCANRVRHNRLRRGHGHGRVHVVRRPAASCVVAVWWADRGKVHTGCQNSPVKWSSWCCKKGKKEEKK